MIPHSKFGRLSPAAGSQDQSLPRRQVFSEGRDEGHQKDAPAKPQGEEHVATPSGSSNTENKKSGSSPESCNETSKGFDIKVNVYICVRDEDW